MYPVGVCDPSLVIEKRHIPGLKDELEQVDNEDGKFHVFVYTYVVCMKP